MSETLTINTPEIDSQNTELAANPYVSSLEGFSDEQVQAAATELGLLLEPILAEHANTMVVCTRLGGAEMTLSAAVNAIWPPSVKGAMIIEGVSSVMAEINGMLASRVEEENVEDEPEEAAEEEQPETKAPERVEQKTPAQETKSKPEVEAKAEAEAEGPANTSTVEVEAAAAETSNQASTPIERPDTAPAATNTNAELKANDAAAESEAKTPATGDSSTELAAVEPEAPQAPEVLVVEVAPSVTPQLELSETVAEPVEAGREAEVEAAAAELHEDYDGAEIYDLISLAEGEEILINHFEEAEFELELAEAELEVEGLVPQAELLFAAAEEFDLQAEDSSKAVEGAEVPIELDLSIEVVEKTFTELAETIEQAEPETIEAANEILDKIVEVPAKLEAEAAAGGEVIFTEAEAQEELEELFTELFDTLGIDYTPELIESIARLSLSWQIADEIKKIKDQEDELQAKDGTHEIIKKILVGLSKLKKALLQAGSIGKSALRLYLLTDMAAGLAAPKLAYAVA